MQSNTNVIVFFLTKNSNGLIFDFSVVFLCLCCKPTVKRTAPNINTFLLKTKFSLLIICINHPSIIRWNTHNRLWGAFAKINHFDFFYPPYQRLKPCFLFCCPTINDVIYFPCISSICLSCPTFISVIKLLHYLFLVLENASFVVLPSSRQK